MKFECIVVYENSPDKFDIEYFQIKVKVSEKLSSLTAIQTLTIQTIPQLVQAT